MGYEDEEVDRTNPSLARVGDRADLIVINEIGQEKQSGSGESGNHEELVASHRLSKLDEDVTADE